MSIVVILVALSLIGTLLFLIRNHMLTINNFFIQIETAEQVHDIFTSEFLIGESTRTEVENALNDGIFDGLDCFDFEFGTDISDSQITCKALGSYDIFIPKYYRIFLGFNEDILTEIRVIESYPDAL